MQFFLLLLLLFLKIVFINNEKISLNGEWQFSNHNKTINGTGHSPGDIFTHLYNEAIIGDPLFGENHLNLKWISNDDWVYQKVFIVPNESDNRFILTCNGLDTISTVFINDFKILHTKNQFLKYEVDITDQINLKSKNSIRIHFQSPTKYATQHAKHYEKIKQHPVPPDCPPTIYHGDCHQNFIRKAQYSFSWDWGPSFPTVGITKDIFVSVLKKSKLLDFKAIPEMIAGIWIIDLQIEIFTENSDFFEIYDVNIPELKLKIRLSSLKFSKRNSDSQIYRANHKVEIPYEKVDLWWPNGLGSQKLYNISVSNDREIITKRFGFRTIELIQDLIDEKHVDKGRHFYFKINGIPMFLKGSNWIPVSMFHNETANEETMRFLLDSASQVGMNALRVWGGGFYETDKFYDYAAEKGILIWQDMMFACALYPTDAAFLENVQEEITQQVERLKQYTSILIFAGNNENEAAIRGHWWKTQNYTENQQVEDYKILYRKVAKIVKSQAKNIPFVMSSPSNGLETDRQGGVSKNPYDVRYGDIHFYNEFINLWRDDSYLTPRCATEYGVQSFPLRNTMLKWINESAWNYKSTEMFHRQHHPGGIATNLLMIFSHLPIPNECGSKSLSDIHRCPLLDSAKFMSRLAYFSQIHQAIALKTQTFHYRRFRNLTTSDGIGNTMCAMYWQLNDVWAAPTWSTVDFEKKWKLAHYEARRFFANVAVYSFIDESDFNLKIHVINDNSTSLQKLSLNVLMYAWADGCDPIYTNDFKIETLPAGSSIAVKDRLKNMKYHELSDYIYVTQLYDSDQKLIYTDVLVPDFLFDVDFKLFGKVEIFEVQKLKSNIYELTIITDKISPFTWIECNKDYVGWFSDNGFHMIDRLVKIQFILWKNDSQGVLSKADFDVCNLANCFV